MAEDATAAAKQRMIEYWRGATSTFVAPESYYLSVEQSLRDDILPLLGHLESVLDVAAGNGRFTFMLANTTENILAVDISPALVAEMATRSREGGLSNFSTAVMDASSDPWPDRKFDLVMCMGLTTELVTLQDFRTVTEKLASHTRMNGFLLVRDTLSTTRQHEARNHKRPSTYWAKRKYMRRFLSLGLEPVRVIRLLRNEKMKRENYMTLLRRVAESPDIKPKNIFAHAIDRTVVL